MMHQGATARSAANKGKACQRWQAMARLLPFKVAEAERGRFPLVKAKRREAIRRRLEKDFVGGHVGRAVVHEEWKQSHNTAIRKMIGPAVL